MLASRVQADELPIINMTPMVDVILCLLVFFMAATRLYDWDENEFVVNVPQVIEAAPLTAAPDDLMLTVIKPGAVAVGESTYDLNGLVDPAARGQGPLRQSGRRDPRRRLTRLPGPGRRALGLRRGRYPECPPPRPVARRESPRDLPPSEHPLPAIVGIDVGRPSRSAFASPARRCAGRQAPWSMGWI